MPDPVIGSFTATGSSSAFEPHVFPSFRQGLFNLTISGTFVGSVWLERSFNGGSDWHPCTSLGASIAFTAPCSEVASEPQPGTLYRLTCTAYTSGTINYRLSQ